MDEVTLILPTYKRYPFLKRLLKYYETHNAKFQIIVLDSTPYDLKDEELSYLLNKSNIIWKKYNSRIKYWQKILDGTSLIKTKYVSLSSDDDFTVPNAIQQCKLFLDYDQDYASVTGLHFNHPSANDVNYYFDFYLILRGVENFTTANQDKSIDRVMSYMKYELTYSPFYALHRTPIFKNIWEETNKYVSDWWFHEFFPCCLSLACGKMQILPILYMSREINTYELFTKDMLQRIFTDEKMQIVIDGIEKHILLNENDSSINVRDVIENELLEIKKFVEKNNNRNIFYEIIKYLGKYRIRTRIKLLLKYLQYKGCYPLIYNDSYEDYLKIKESVLSANLSKQQLNEAKRDFV